MGSFVLSPGAVFGCSAPPEGALATTRTACASFTTAEAVTSSFSGAIPRAMRPSRTMLARFSASSC
jgi:hypothetical protein